MISKTKYICIAVIALFADTNIVNAGPICAYGQGGAPGRDIVAPPVVVDQMLRIENALCGKFGCPQYLFAASYTTSNASAWNQGNAYAIRYNPDFMNGLYFKFGGTASGAVFAHELGHIIDFHNGPSSDRVVRESTADRYAGCVFALTGYPESGLLPAANALMSMGDSPGYPTAAERVELMRAGYKNCR